MSKAGKIYSRQEILKQLQSGDLNYTGANFRWLDLSGINFFTGDPFTAHFRSADLQGADLCEADMNHTGLCGVNLNNALLSRANLQGADLRRSDLRQADFSAVNLRNADLGGADLRNANFNNSDLRETNFSAADLRYSKFFRSDLSGATFTGTRIFGVMGAQVKTQNVICEWLDNSKEGDGSVEWHIDGAQDVSYLINSSVSEIVVTFRNRLSPETISGWMSVMKALKVFHAGVLNIDNISGTGRIRLSPPRKKDEIIPFVAGLLKYCLESHSPSREGVTLNQKMLSKLVTTNTGDEADIESTDGIQNMLKNLPSLPPAARDGIIQKLSWKNLPRGTVSLDLELADITVEGNLALPPPPFDSSSALFYGSSPIMTGALGRAILQLISNIRSSCN